MRGHFNRQFAGISRLLLIVLLSVATAANAQQTLGSVNGTVLDASGAAISGSTLTLSDPDIGVTRTVTAGSNGYFQIFNLPVGTYSIQATHAGFDATTISGIGVQEARAITVALKLNVGQITEQVEVTANPLLNATDATNGYTLDQEQIALTPLATGSFTQLAILSPGINSELLSSLDTNAGLGNQPIWSNGQRATSNTFQVNGVDVSNIFNGSSASALVSQRYNFNIGQGTAIGGISQTGTSVYGSNGNSLPSPASEFTQELRVNTSLYDAQQGATSGAQIDVNTLSGTNSLHGQVYGTFADNYANADPFFFKQEALLAQQGVGAFPGSLANPQLHRWTTGASIGGPIKKDKLFFFVGYQHLYASDESTGLSQLTVPTGLSDDRSTTGLTNALASWNGGTVPTSFTGFSQQALDLLQTKLPNGQYLIPSAQTSAAYQYGVPNVTLKGVSVLAGDQGTASLDYDLKKNDRLTLKYYYQNNPLTKPFGFSETGGFPTTTSNTAQVGVIDNTISIGSRMNWEQRLGYERTGTYSYYNQTVTDTTTPGAGGSFGIGTGAASAALLNPGILPGLSLERFATNATVGVPTVDVGPDSAFVDIGYHQNRLNPSTNLIFTLGKHTIVAGAGYSYTQLNLDNNRNGHGEVATQGFQNFLEGVVYTSGSATNVLNSIENGRNLADRYYRSNEIDGYVQDRWQVLPNLSLTGGVRYDYHGGLTEKYGNIFNFNPNTYNVTGTDTTGFTVLNAGFEVAGNNKQFPTAGVSDSTLTGRQWGVSPRVAFAFSPEADGGKVVISGGAGIYYDRGELFTYLSQPAGTGIGGPFGVTESAPLASYTTATGKKNTLANPFATNSAPPAPNSNPGTINAALQNQLNAMTATGAFGFNCGGIGQEEDENCPAPLNFGSYNKNNVLPYTINFTLKMQWQPRSDLSVSLGYVGNRGRHSVIPIPINEAAIATASSPAPILGASPHSSGETDSYGFEVLNTASYTGYDYNPITTEPWSTYDGGNVDFRAPYVGYNPNATLFSTVGTSAYDALETHLEKRLTHHVQAGISYTWSHALDEQSDIGLFFTGNNPNNLKQSYASSDFDRTHVISGNFQLQLPNATQTHSFLSYLTNDWNLTGIGIVQSGEPYSLYEFYGASGSAYVGNYPSLENPVIGIQDPKNPKSALTGSRGLFRGTGGSYMPTINPGALAVNYLAPGEKGVPTLAQDSNPSDPVDIYETDFATGNQRNIFRQAMQKRLDLSVRKTFRVSDRVHVQYAFNVFNVFNTTSEDIPQDSAHIRQLQYTCSAAALNVAGDNCAAGYTYGQVGTSNKPGDQQSALAHLDQKPVYSGTGTSTSVPLTIPLTPSGAVGAGACTPSGEISAAQGCPNNDANFGSVTGTIGGGRAMTMSLHITY